MDTPNEWHAGIGVAAGFASLAGLSRRRTFGDTDATRHLLAERRDQYNIRFENRERAQMIRRCETHFGRFDELAARLRLAREPSHRIRRAPPEAVSPRAGAQASPRPAPRSGVDTVSL